MSKNQITKGIVLEQLLKEYKGHSRTIDEYHFTLPYFTKIATDYVDTIKV